MTIRQSRYILAETEQEKKVRVTEAQRVEEDPFIRRSEVQQTVNNSTLPVSSRAVNLAINSIDVPSLDGYATESYVDQKFGSIDLSSYASITYVDERFNSIDLRKYLTIENANQTYSTKAELAEKWDTQETVGSGKVVREGAYGLGGISEHLVGDKLTGHIPSGIYRITASTIGEEPFRFGTMLSMPYAASDSRQVQLAIDNTTSTLKVRATQNSREWVEILSHKNTRTDKNNVLHSGTSTPLTTLNTSDMAQDVVDRDDVTVTSGAVYRAIGQLMDQIASLDARVKELEDGGV